MSAKPLTTPQYIADTPAQITIPAVKASDINQNAVDNISNAVRAEGDKWEAKAKKLARKIKEYKKKYPRESAPSELLTNEVEKLDTGFVPPFYKTDERRSIGSGAIFPTSAIAKDDRSRISKGISAKGVISNRFTTYSEKDIILVDLKEADQYFGTAGIYSYQGLKKNPLYDPMKYDASKPDTYEYINKKKKELFGMPFLKGVTTFLPLLPPPNDKNFQDYLNDIVHFGIGGPVASINQALGQATNRAHMTVKQLTLNQSFMIIDSEFFQMSTKPDAKPVTTVKNPRITMFYKKFIDTDDAWETTVPGGNATYNSMIPPKEQVEEFMKIYMSSPAFGGRLESSDKDIQIKETINLAFQNLQLSDDAYEMIKHTMAAAYVNLVTSIADMYMRMQRWENDMTIGTLAGYPAGLIMPQHLNHMFCDPLWGAPDIGKGYAALDALRNNHHPYYRAIFNLREAFLIPKLNDEQTSFRRLYKDGYEWLNAQTPNRVELVEMFNAEATSDYAKNLSTDWSIYETNLKANPFNSSGIPYDYNVSGASKTEIVKTDPKKIPDTMYKNYLIQRSIEEYVKPNQKPTGFQLFQTWDITEETIMDVERTPKVGYKRRNDNPQNFRAKKINQNSNLKNAASVKMGIIGSLANSLNKYP